MASGRTAMPVEAAWAGTEPRATSVPNRAAMRCFFMISPDHRPPGLRWRRAFRVARAVNLAQADVVAPIIHEVDDHARSAGAQQVHRRANAVFQILLVDVLAVDL